MLIVAVPSQPGLQVAFVVLNTLIGAADGFTKVNILDFVQLFASAAITVYIPVPKLLKVPEIACVGVHVEPTGLCIEYVIVPAPPTAKTVALPSHPGKQEGFVCVTIFSADGPAGVDKLITTLPEQELPSFTIIVYAVPAHKPVANPVALIEAVVGVIET